MANTGKEFGSKDGKFDYEQIKTSAKTAIDTLADTSKHKPLFQQLYKAADKKDNKLILETNYKIADLTIGMVESGLSDLKSEYDSYKTIINLHNNHPDFFEAIDALSESPFGFSNNFKKLKNMDGVGYEHAKSSIPILEEKMKVFTGELENTKKMRAIIEATLKTYK